MVSENGSLIEKTAYSPNGQVLSGGNSSKYLYTGKERDLSSSLYYYGARYYNPETGQFTQPDSVMGDVYDPQQLNAYSYARNNPYKYVDPSGNFIDTILDIGFVGYDLYSIVQNPKDSSNYISLGLDLGGTAIPFVTGLGTGFKLAKGAEKAKDVVKLGKYGEDVADLGLKSFTKSNFRENVLKQTLESGVGTEIHHNLPQQFLGEFEKAGININDPVFGSVVDKSIHRQTARSFNLEVADFFEKNINPTREQIINTIKDISNKFNFNPRF